MANKNNTKKRSVKNTTPTSLPNNKNQNIISHNENESFDLNIQTYKLLTSEPFFAAVSRYVTKISSYSLPTAGVTVDKRTANFVLYYNPDFFKTLTAVQKLAVLKHEYYHLILEHVTGRKPTSVDDSKMWNFATDLAINSFLENELPEYCLIPGKGKFTNYPKFECAEWYFNKLKQDPNFKKNKDGQNSEGQFDDHTQWELDEGKEGESGAVARELANERLKDVLRKAAQEVVSNGNNWGSVSEVMRKDILSRLTSRLDWKKVLRYFIKTSQRSDKSITMRKINKRYAYIYPGKKINRHAKIAISIDQSGSVSDEMLTQFFSELNALAEIAEFTVIPFDHGVAVDKIYVWKRGQSHKTERVLCGGTDFNAPTQYVNDNKKFDGHIILTDLCAPKPVPSKCQRMWITSEECAKQPYFHTTERIIAIPVIKGK